MAFVETGMNFDDVKEKKALPKEKYTIMLEHAEVKGGDGTGKLQVSVRASAVGHPEAKTIFKSLWLPMQEDEPEKRENKMRALKKFLDRFKIPYVGAKFDTDTFAGRQADCVLTLKEYPEGSGEFTNEIQV